MKWVVKLIHLATASLQGQERENVLYGFHFYRAQKNEGREKTIHLLRKQGPFITIISFDVRVDY